MHSTFMGVELGKRGVFAHQTLLNTTGHNISNLNTEGYSRQRVKLGTMDPLYAPAFNRVETKGQLGQGPLTARVERVFDNLHERQVLSASDDLGYWKSRDQYIEKLEIIYNEPNETSVRSFMDKFWSSWQDLADSPESLSSRAVVAQNGKALSQAVNHRYAALDEQRKLLNDEIKITVRDINVKTQGIADLNNQIAMSRALGDEPNDLLDKRDLLVSELAHLVPLSATDRDTDEFQVHVDGHILVQGSIAHPLSTLADPDNESLALVKWGKEDAPHKNDPAYDDVLVSGGKLGALMELRDKDVKEEINKLDAMAIHFADMVNDLHRQGFGKNGENGLDFFVQLPIIENVAGNYDRDSDGAFDHTYLFRLSGANKLEANQQVGLEGTITLSGAQGNIEVPYYAADTVGDIVSRINYSGSEVMARLDSQGRLSLKGSLSSTGGEPDFVVRHVEDSGQFLVGYAGLLTQSGADGAYDYAQPDAGEAALRTADGASYATAPLRHPSAWLAVNERIAADLNYIAATMATPNGEAAVGDGRMAIAIADLRHEKVMIDRLSSLDDFFADSAAVIGAKGREAEDTHLAYQAIYQNLKDIKESISGVNINEEFADMVKFQHGFSASARFITVCDEMLDTIINRMGV